jgi:hypothetical protein
VFDRRFNAYEVSFEPPTTGLSFPYEMVESRDALTPLATR